MTCARRVVIAPGGPAGIDPGLMAQLAQREWPVEPVIYADATLLDNQATILGLLLLFLPHSPDTPTRSQSAGTLILSPTTLRAPVVAGQLAVENGQYAVDTLTHACNGCLQGELTALITSPVHKGVINGADVPFTGCVEFFEERS